MYDGADTWSGPAPQQLLSKALNAIPGAKITKTTSSISVTDTTDDGAGGGLPAVATGSDEAPPSQTFTFAMEVSALGAAFTVDGTAATAAGAREAVALAALHKYAPSRTCAGGHHPHACRRRVLPLCCSQVAEIIERAYVHLRDVVRNRVVG